MLVGQCMQFLWVGWIRSLAEEPPIALLVGAGQLQEQWEHEARVLLVCALQRFANGGGRFRMVKRRGSAKPSVKLFCAP